MNEQAVLDALNEADLEILGLLPYASNATLLTKGTVGDLELLAVYKPRRGERPLWDFPDGTLCLREYAAWVVSRDLGWNLVPPTVLREGPAGFGAVQLFIEEDDTVDIRRVAETHPNELMKIALFDVVTNNADRKAGHLIVDTDNKLWGVDHGVCFSEDPKLRTVIWAFEREPIPNDLVADLERYVRSPSGDLAEVLHPIELEALCRRLSTLVTTKRFPAPDPGGRNVPWPPW